MSTLSSLIQTLVQAKIPSPRLEARLMLAHVLSCDKDDAKMMTVELSAEEQKKLDRVLQYRLQEHWPLDKIIGIKGFYKYDFMVSEDVLSPRPDTEILLEQALEISADHQISILDLGTGSGCLLLSLLKENPLATGMGVDISAKALAIAQKNAQRLQVEDRVTWIQKDWFAPNFISGQFDIIVSNPPYIPDADIAALDDEVRLHDPMLALSGGKDGYDSYRRIAALAPSLLKANGYILLEAGIHQAQQIAEIFSAQGLTLCRIVPDLSGINRCVILKK